MLILHSFEKPLSFPRYLESQQQQGLQSTIVKVTSEVMKAVHIHPVAHMPIARSDIPGIDGPQESLRNQNAYDFQNPNPYLERSYSKSGNTNIKCRR